MAALGAVAQHYIKFPGFDAGWNGRVEVVRTSKSFRIFKLDSSGFSVYLLYSNVRGKWLLEIGQKTLLAVVRLAI